MSTAEARVSVRRSAYGSALAVAALSGALVATQGRINGDLASDGAGPILAGWLCYVGTVATAVLALVVLGRARSTVAILRARGRWWWFAIGLCGMPIVVTMAYGAPVIGVALASVCSVAGQTVSGLILDARGVGLARRIRLSAKRVLAGICALCGLGVAVVSGSGPAHVSVLAVILAGLGLFLGGLILSGQQAGNGAVASQSGDALIAGFTSTTGGLIGISLVTAVVGIAGGFSGVTLPSLLDSWWLYLGGPLGIAITVAAAWSVRRLGTFALTLAIVGGQMVMAILLDAFGGFSVHWSTLLAIGAIAASVVLAVNRNSAKSAARPKALTAETTGPVSASEESTTLREP